MYGWLSLDSIPERTTLCISLPNSEAWQAQFRGAILALTKAENWEGHGTLTALEMSDEWRSVFFDFVNGVCSMFPVGSVMAYAGSVAPDGWLMCNGQAVSRSTYADLFALVDLTYGFGDASTTFNVPDLRSRVPVGRDLGYEEFTYLGQFGGEIDHALTVGEMPVHNHTQNSHNHTQNSHNHTQDTHTHTQNSHTHTQDTHTHTQNSHTHDFNSSTGGALTVYAAAVTTVGQVQTSIVPGKVATNQTTVATNQATTPTNQTTVAINQATTPTNQTTVAINQNSGGGGSHNNLQPYLTLNYIIKF